MKQFQPEQLRSARRLKAFSLQDLADTLGEQGKTLSKQGISKYETGIVEPPIEVLHLLAKALEVPLDYFYHTDTVELGDVKFRKLDKYSARESERIIEYVKIELSKYIELESLMNIDSTFDKPPIPNDISSPKDIDDYADKLRESWGLGTAPIANVIETLEDKHLKVIQVESGVELDGFSTKANGIYPVIVLNKSKLDNYQDRKRWTALHELGHILLAFKDDITHKEEERFCHYFAGSMLFPRRVLEKEIGKKRSRLSFEELGALKQEYGISMQAIVYRAKELEVISESYYRQFFFLFNQMGYKTTEPVAYVGKKASNRFDQLLFRALMEKIITIEKASEFKGLTVTEFRKRYALL